MKKIKDEIFKEETPKVKEAPVLPPQVQKTALPTKVLAATLEYLATRPYRDVFELVNAIQTQSEPVK